MIVQSSPALALPDNREAGSKAAKFWVYEQAIRIPFYAIYEVEKASVAVYQLVDAHYQRCSSNERGHFAIASLVWSVNPNLTAMEVRQILTDTAMDLGVVGRDDLYGYGLVDAAVRRAYAMMQDRALAVLV